LSIAYGLLGLLLLPRAIASFTPSAIQIGDFVTERAGKLTGADML